MELIVINENKLKITLSATDMHKYGLDENEFHLSITNTRRVLSKILHNSPIKTGFESETPNERLLLQLYPEKGGGCELYVTRLIIDSENCEKEEIGMAEQENRLLPIAKSQFEQKTGTLCYKFENFSNLISACRASVIINSPLQSSLFFGDDEKYYLFVENRSLNEDSQSINLFLEFGELENSERARLALYEHGKEICKSSAINMLSQL